MHVEMTRTTSPPKGTICKHCGKVGKKLVPINTIGDYVCEGCCASEGYEFDPTPP